VVEWEHCQWVLRSKGLRYQILEGFVVLGVVIDSWMKKAAAGGTRYLCPWP